jgi:hypothetical protein
MRNESEKLTQIPVRFIQFYDGIYIRGAVSKYANLVGGKVLKVGGVDIDSAMKRINSIVSHDPGNLGQQLAWGAKIVPQ